MTEKNQIFGMLNINKPDGFTSHDVVAKLRRILKIKQIGHTGTLDPMATGVLPICIGRATKVIQYLDDTKAYRAFIKLGVITDTYDTEGKVLEKNPVKLDIEKVKALLKEFQGEIKQTPPIYSAIHYNGKRLYEYARENVVVEDIPSRTVIIKSIELIDVENASSDFPVLVIDVDCSSGTYIRSIAYDLGEKLGCGATLSGLIRTRAGKFILDESKTLEEIEELAQKGLVERAIISPGFMTNLKIHNIDDNILEKIKKGQYFQIKNKEMYADNEFIQLVYKNKLVAIASVCGNKISPKNVFV